MPRSLNDMVVIITGASAGIGRALAVQLAGAGAKLVLGARRVDRLQELNEQLGGGHMIMAADVSVREDCEKLIDATLARFGRIDTLVANAGYGFLQSVETTTPEQMQAVFQTNVFGTLDCIRPALPHIHKQAIINGYRGQVMMVSSAVARRAIPYFGAYSATKAAQLSLGEALRIELSSAKIAVTTVHPGGTDTEFGQVAAALSGGKRPQRIPGELRQTSEQVARAMVKAIIRPRPEVWPMRTYHLMTSLGTLFPGLVDRIMVRRREQIGGDGN